MDLTTATLIAVGLFLALWIPYFLFYIRRGKAHGHTWFTRSKPRGHSDIGPDTGFRPTRPGADDARDARY
jgi:hypothetical protein